MFERMSNNERVVAALLIIVILAAIAEIGQSLVLLLIIGAIIYAVATRDQPEEDTAADFSTERRSSRSRRVELPPERDSRPANVDTVHTHALTAVRQAGIDPDRVSVLPVDVGVMTFSGESDPVIHRTWPVEDDSDYLQPFVQLRVPQTAIGRIKFEVLDSYHQTVFVHEDRYQLERGRNLVIPAARLPLHDEQNINGSWHLKVYADGILLANHTFTWESREQPSLDPHIGEDGEINSELRAVLADSRLGRMSLDELLEEESSAEDDNPQNRDALRRSGRS
ncbi:MAG: hypothetical protein ACOCYT_02245 [Chloroflexota bacterium]